MVDVGWVAGAEQGRWRLVRQRRAEEALAAKREHRQRRTVHPPVLRVLALDPVTGRSACGYRDTLALGTAWFDTPVGNRCAECAWRLATG
jgi:hypothetical protein